MGPARNLTLPRRGSASIKTPDATSKGRWRCSALRDSPSARHTPDVVSGADSDTGETDGDDGTLIDVEDIDEASSHRGDATTNTTDLGLEVSRERGAVFAEASSVSSVDGNTLPLYARYRLQSKLYGT